MGSVPINYGKLFLVSLLVEIASFFAAIVLRIILALDLFDGTKIQEGRDIVWFLLVAGFIYFFSMVKNTEIKMPGTPTNSRRGAKSPIWNVWMSTCTRNTA